MSVADKVYHKAVNEGLAANAEVETLRATLADRRARIVHLEKICGIATNALDEIAITKCWRDNAYELYMGIAKAALDKINKLWP